MYYYQLYARDYKSESEGGKMFYAKTLDNAIFNAKRILSRSENRRMIMKIKGNDRKTIGIVDRSENKEILYYPRKSKIGYIIEEDGRHNKRAEPKQ